MCGGGGGARARACVPVCVCVGGSGVVKSSSSQMDLFKFYDYYVSGLTELKYLGDLNYSNLIKLDQGLHCLLYL